MPLRVVTFKMEEEEVDRLDYYARRKGLSRSEVIREAVRQYVTKNIENLPKPRYVKI